MLNKEGPKNLFRILQCRDIDMESLQGILIDHACLVDPYILNREADMLEWKLLLVDGAHWNGMKTEHDKYLNMNIFTFKNIWTLITC